MKTKINNIKEKISNNKVFKILALILSIVFSAYLYLIPNTLVNGGLFVFGLFIFFIYLLIYILKRIIKKQKIHINFEKERFLKLLLNSLMIGILINSAFFVILQFFSPELSYTYAFGNYEAYGNATTWVYLLMTVIIIPLFNNLLLRKQMNKFNSKKGKIIFGILLSIFIFLTSATYISGLYFMLINLFLNFLYMNNKCLKEIFLIESIIALVLASMTLLLSSYKTIVILIMLTICLITFMLNLKESLKNK